MIIPVLLALPSLLVRKVRYSRFANKVRIQKYALLGVSIGSGTVIRPGAIFKGCRNIQIGQDVYIGEGARLTAYGATLSIGRDCLLAENCYISTRNHVFRDLRKTIRSQGYKAKPVVIEANCWLAYGAVVTAGSHLCSGTVVAANAVYSQDLNSESPCLVKLERSVEFIADAK